jgi:hypothetical protein
MSFSKIASCEAMTRLTEFSFLFYEIILILRAVGRMTRETSISKGFMPCSTYKSVLFVAAKTLVIADFSLKKLIIRGMRIMAGKTFTLLQCRMYISRIIHIQGHLFMAEITELILLPFLEC